MPFSSPFPDLNIPKCNLLEYLFPAGKTPSDTPIWIDAKDPNHYLTPRTLLQWTKRLALALDRVGSKPGEVVMIHTPNHIFVPVAYLGIVGSKRIFSGANPAYTVSGKSLSNFTSDNKSLTMDRNGTPNFQHSGPGHPSAPFPCQNHSYSSARGRSTRRPRFLIFRRTSCLC